MPVTIKGARLDQLSISRADDASGNIKVSGSYALISSVDRVLATQAFGSYGGVEIKPSAETIKKMDAFIAAFKGDINSTLGLEGGEQ